ncbi:hypothetical protein CEXT_598611 [Caerostris extrusa]|uniref:Uncharacterized protein n=1 Tax=Caerostris extrusa TaxID=172846 RepID=A0AAV4XWW3_CAEEX|nr:hypothetical protein CEXT_598611 [Caerostris extrusa]
MTPSGEIKLSKSLDSPDSTRSCKVRFGSSTSKIYILQTDYPRGRKLSSKKGIPLKQPSGPESKVYINKKETTSNRPLNCPRSGGYLDFEGRNSLNQRTLQYESWESIVVSQLLRRSLEDTI